MPVEGRFGKHQFAAHERIRGWFGRRRFYGRLCTSDRRPTVMIDLGPPRNYDINERFAPGFRERLLREIEARRRIQEWQARNPDSEIRPTDREE